MKNTKLVTIPENYKTPMSVKVVTGIFLVAFVYVLLAITLGLASAIYTFIRFVIIRK